MSLYQGHLTRKNNMANTRDFISLGIWADDADTVIPPSPIPGTPYRNEGVTPGQNEAGLGYQNEADSADFNQKMYIISSFTDTINTHGIPGWSDQVSYDMPAVVWASNGEFYFALGPSLGQDPISSPSDWQLVAGMGELNNETPGSEGTRLVGHTGFTLASFLPFARCRVDGTGALSQNFNFATAVRNGLGDFSVTFTNAQPSADYQISLNPSNLGVSVMPHVANPYTQSTTGFSYNVWEADANATLEDVIVDIFVYPGAPLT